MAVYNLLQSTRNAVCAAGSYIKQGPSKLKNGVLNSAASVVHRSIAQPMIQQTARFEQLATQMLSQGQKGALKKLDQGVAEISDCAKSAKKLMNTVDNVVKTGAELVSFVAGLYVFNLPGKARKMPGFASTVQKIAGLSIAASASLHWLNRMAKPYIEEQVLSRLIPKKFLKFW